MICIYIICIYICMYIYIPNIYIHILHKAWLGGLEVGFGLIG